jgi:hypothetical protein
MRRRDFITLSAARRLHGHWRRARSSSFRLVARSAI